MKPPPSARWTTFIQITALFFLICGAKLWLIKTSGNSVPYWDQWDAEAALLVKPLSEGTLPWSQLTASHNEHRILLTRLLSIAALKANGLWDPMVLMVIQAFIHTTAICLFLLATLKSVNRALTPLFLTFAGLVFIIPFGWENTLWGFQSQFYFQILFGVVALWLAWKNETLTAGWWMAVVVAIVGLFTMAGGLFAAAACVGFSLIRIWCTPSKWKREILGVLIMGAVMVAGFVLTKHVAGHDFLKAKSASALITMFAKICSWPIRFNWACFITLGPAVILAIQVLRERGTARDARDPRWLLLGLAALAFMQVFAIAYGRNIGAFASRYSDNFTITLCVGLACVCSLRAVSNFWRLALNLATCGWILLVGGFLFNEVRLHTIHDINSKSEESKRQANVVSTYIATRNPAALAGQPVYEVPYPKADRLQMLLDTPSIAASLPTDLRLPLAASAPAAGDAGFIEKGFAPDTPARDLDQTWGSFGPGGATDQGKISLTFAGERRTRIVRVFYSGSPSANGNSLILIDSEGVRHNLAKSAVVARWRSVFVKLPKGPFSIVATDTSDAAWLAFSAPREVGSVWMVTNFLASQATWMISLGAVLLAAPWVLRANRSKEPDAS